MPNNNTTDAPQAEATVTDDAGQSTAGDAAPKPEPPKPKDPVEDKPVDGEDALGDPGKQALDRMKAERKAAVEARKDAEAKLAEALAKIEGKEKEFAEEQARRKVEAAALEKANDRIRKAEVRAAAAGVLNDPADALHYLDLAEFEVSDDGDVDRDAIKAAVQSLVKSKPYLAAQGGGTVFESPSAHRENVAQITRDQLKGMTPEQIVQAKREGRLKSLGY